MLKIFCDNVIEQNIRGMYYIKYVERGYFKGLKFIGNQRGMKEIQGRQNFFFLKLISLSISYFILNYFEFNLKVN